MKFNTRILYLCDDTRAAGVFADIVRAAGFEIICLHTRKDLEEMTLEVYNLFITELFFEGTDCIDLCRTLRQKNYGGKIIALGFIELPNTTLDIFDELAVQYIIRDFGPNELIKIITDCMG